MAGHPANLALKDNGGREQSPGFSEPMQSGVAGKTGIGGSQSQAVPSWAAEHPRRGAEGLTTANGFAAMS